MPHNKLLTLPLLILPFLFSTIGCGKRTIRDNTIFVTRSGEDQVSKTTPVTDEGDIGTPISLKDLEAAIGLRSYEQVRETMTTLTNINPTAPNIASIYSDVKTQLPNNNDIKTFLASHQVGITKIGVEFCDTLIDRDDLRASMFPGFSFTSAPRTAFSSGSSADLAEAMMDQFWGSGLSNLPDKSTALNTIENLTDDLLEGENLNDTSVTLQVSKGICTAVLASSPVAIF